MEIDRLKPVDELKLALNELENKKNQLETKIARLATNSYDNICFMDCLDYNQSQYIIDMENNF